MNISTVILTKNEEATIARVIRSAKFSDEIIVLNDSSIDKTKEIAEKNGATVLERQSNNDFAAQRNYGLEKAKGEWVLFLDADEELSDALQSEIKDFVTKGKRNQTSVYYLKRRDFFWGRELRFGETSSARNRGIIRLVKKNSGKWSGKVHEQFQPSGPTSALNGFINHYPHPTIKKFLESVNHYSSLRARELHELGKKPSSLELLFYPPSKFIYTYFIKLGFMDGPAGFVYSFMMSFHSFLVRAKLYQLHNS